MAALSLRGVGLLKIPTGSTSALVNVVPSCNYASEVRQREINTASMKRGRGGRSSFSGDVVTVFGSNGLIGTGVANRLGKNGSQMILPYRGEHYKMMRMKVCGDLGQVLFCPIELTDEDSIRRAVSHSNIVINLIGRSYETSNFSYEDVNITGPQTIARICKEAGVKRFVHMSHIAARENPETAFLPGGSRFLKSKYQGELAVFSEFPDATIFRAADVYGEGDNFLNYWMTRFRRNRFGQVPLYGKGLMTIKQPIFHYDVVSGIMNSLYDPSAVGQIYEAMGPNRLTQAELITYMYHLTERYEEETTFGINELMLSPVAVARSIAFSKLIGKKNCWHGQSLDRLERDSVSDLSEGYPNITELGVKLSTLAERLPFELEIYGLHAYYQYEDCETKVKVPPPREIAPEEERALLAMRKMGTGLSGLLPGPLRPVVHGLVPA